MAVKGLKAVGMLDGDAVAIAVVGTREGDNSVESGQDFVVGTGLDVYTGMLAFATVWTYHMTARQRIGPMLTGYLLQIDFKFFRLFVGQFVGRVETGGCLTLTLG